jgi:hypothetical protein
MAGVSAGAQPGSYARTTGPRRAAGIYGTIITAAILAAAGDHVPTLPLAVSILVTLLVYWLAEEYAELLGEQLEAGHPPTWADVRMALAATWPMVSSSYIPLLSLIPARLLGASPLPSWVCPGKYGPGLGSPAVPAWLIAPCSRYGLGGVAPGTVGA